MSSQLPEQPESGSDVQEGTVINGKFRIVSLLATGGMGRIYRAEQAPLGRIVAVKVLRTPAVSSETIANEFRKRFFREASILAKLQHANVVTLFDYGRIESLTDERYFMAMEYLAGDTLSLRLRKVHSLPVADSLRILRQIARGLREAHKLGVVHRDLKPSNVMLVPEEDGVEVVKILDFGIGKLLGSDEDQEITQEGAFLGSPKYIAPEQVNERRVDQRTDVYALGVIGYECLCGRVPFEGQTNLETILAHTSKPVMPMAERSPGIVVPEIVEAFVRRCLEKEPENRPQSMEEVLRAIGECERALYGAGSLGSSTSSGGMLAQHVALRPSDSKTLALGPPPVPVFRPSVGTASPVTRMDAPPPPRSRLPVALAIALLALAVGGFAVVRLTTRDAARAGELPSTAPATSPPAAPRSFTLVLDSQPSGADVWDGDDVIGATPMQVTIDRAGVKAGPRRFIVKLDGYAPYTVLQGDSESIVKVTAPLDLLPPAPSASGAAAPSASGPPPLRGQAPRWTPPPRPNPNAAHPPPDTDIKLQR